MEETETSSLKRLDKSQSRFFYNKILLGTQLDQKKVRSHIRPGNLRKAIKQNRIKNILLLVNYTIYI